MDFFDVLSFLRVAFFGFFATAVDVAADVVADVVAADDVDVAADVDVDVVAAADELLSVFGFA